MKKFSFMIFIFLVEFSSTAFGSDFGENGIPEEKLQLGAAWGRKFCRWKVEVPQIPSDPAKSDPAMGHERNLIVGIAKGSAYTYDKVLPFCKSVRKAGFQGEVILGISRLKGIETQREQRFLRNLT